MPEPILLNPTNPEHQGLVQQLIEQELARKRNPFDNLELLPETRYELNQGGEKRSCVLSHAIVQFHINDLSDKAKRFAVYEPTAIGAGSFANIHTVNGMLKYKTGRWHYKTEPSYVMKRFTGKNRKVQAHQLMLEQLMSADDPSLLSKYPLNTVEVGRGEEYFYFQRMQKGSTLQQLITDEKKFGPMLTARERIALGLALVQRMEEIHKRRFKIKGIDLGYLIHRDIKPDNIFILDDGEVVIGDFGLATATQMKNPDPSKGTPLYSDPRLMEPNPVDNQEADDWFSMAITLCELFGGHFRDELPDSLNALHQQNRDIPVMEYLFKGINDLSEMERKHISEALYNMTRQKVSDRRPASILEILFKIMLNVREADEQKAVEGFSPEDIRDSVRFNETSLFALLKSNLGSVFLEKNQGQLPVLVAALGSSFVRLPENILREFALKGYDFRAVKLGPLLRSPQPLAASKLSLLLELGAELRLEDLQYWFSGPIDKNSRQRWLETARLLFAARPLQADHAVRTVCTDLFKMVCYDDFIGNNDLDSAAACRLANRKVQAKHLYGDLAALTQGELACLYEPVRTFYQAYLSNDLLTIAKNDLYLCNYIYNFLFEIDQFYALLDMLVDDENMAYQTLFIASWMEKIQSWIDENNPQWRTTSVATLASRSNEIKKLRQLLGKKLNVEHELRGLAGIGADSLYNDLLVLVDETYEKQETEAMVLDADPDRSQFAKGMFFLKTLFSVDQILISLAVQGLQVDSLTRLVKEFKQSASNWGLSTLDRDFYGVGYIDTILSGLTEITAAMANIRGYGIPDVNWGLDDEMTRLRGLDFTGDIWGELQNCASYCNLASMIVGLLQGYQQYFPETVSYVRDSLLLLLARRDYANMGPDIDCLGQFCRDADRLRFLDSFINRFMRLSEDRRHELRLELQDQILGFMLSTLNDQDLNQWLAPPGRSVRLAGNPYALHKPAPASDNLAGDSDEEDEKLWSIPD